MPKLRETVIVDRPIDEAFAYTAAYEAAIATGQQGLALSAEIGLAQGHLGGVFGSLSDSSEGLRIPRRTPCPRKG